MTEGSQQYVSYINPRPKPMAYTGYLTNSTANNLSDSVVIFSSRSVGTFGHKTLRKDKPLHGELDAGKKATAHRVMVAALVPSMHDSEQQALFSKITHSSGRWI